MRFKHTEATVTLGLVTNSCGIPGSQQHHRHIYAVVLTYEDGAAFLIPMELAERLVAPADDITRARWAGLKRKLAEDAMAYGTIAPT